MKSHDELVALNMLIEMSIHLDALPKNKESTKACLPPAPEMPA